MGGRITSFMTQPIPSERWFDVQLVDRALAVVNTVIQRRGRHWRISNDLRDDIRSEVMVRLVRRLRDDEGEPIAAFEDYVASLASRVIDDVIRTVSPEWTRLKHRVRYVLNHDDRFRIDVFTHGRILCSVHLPAISGRRRVHSHAATELARMMLDLLQQEPRTIDELVNALAERLGIIDPVRMNMDRMAFERAATTESIVETTEYLRRLWSEISELPPRQRLALLLNSRDENGESVLRLLAGQRIVDIPDIASVLQITLADLDRLWNELPLTDLEIADRLHVTRQQVINLRKAARDRLARRMTRIR